MNYSSGMAKSFRLLKRLGRRPADEEAWSEFARCYGKQIFNWCSRWGLQEADALDVTQSVLLKLVRILPSFALDRSRQFDGWLLTLTRHTAFDLLLRRRKLVALPGDPFDLEPSGKATPNAGLAKLVADDEQELLGKAIERVRPRVQPRTWQAFHLTAIEGLSGAEVAHRLTIPLASVYKARSNIQKRLRAEVQVLEGVSRG